MPESELLQEWTNQAVAKKSRDLLLRLLEQRFPHQTVQELRPKIGSESDGATLDQWFDIALKSESATAFRAAIGL